MHPDATWGDGLGFSIAVQSGFDWATNANSHWLYLNFHHLLLQIIPGLDAIQWLGWVSWFWSLASLYLLWRLVRKMAGSKAGVWSIHLFASCFTIWRHASIIEVYSMATFFWLLALIFFERALRKPSMAIWFSVIHSLGLLVHVQMIFLFPLLLILLRNQKPARLWWFFWPYILPVLAIIISVYILKTNDLLSVLFDNKADEMSRGVFGRLIYGFFFIPAFSGFLFPLGMLGLVYFIFQKWMWRHWKSDLFRKVLLLLASINLLFCICFPETGVHVFLIPDFLIMSIFLGESMAFKFPALSAFWAWVVLQLTTGFYLTLFFISSHFRLFPISAETSWKGGSGYYLLPWARGNASSVLEMAKKAETFPAPPSLDWNFQQAKTWNNIKSKP